MGVLAFFVILGIFWIGGVIGMVYSLNYMTTMIITIFIFWVIMKIGGKKNENKNKRKFTNNKKW